VGGERGSSEGKDFSIKTLLKVDIQVGANKWAKEARGKTAGETQGLASWYKGGGFMANDRLEGNIGSGSVQTKKKNIHFQIAYIRLSGGVHISGGR